MMGVAALRTRRPTARLFVAEHTFRNHLTAIYQKLGVANRLELYIYAIKYQLDVLPH